MNTTEKNRMIAEFMGVDTNSNGEFYLPQFGTIRPNGGFKTDFADFQLKYHASWDWLMPVVDKINNTGRFEVRIGYGHCYITDGKGELTLSMVESTTFYAVYKAVVEFIKWYNEKNK